MKLSEPPFRRSDPTPDGVYALAVQMLTRVRRLTSAQSPISSNPFA